MEIARARAVFASVCRAELRLPANRFNDDGHWSVWKLEAIMHPFMALWIWASLAPMMAQRMFDPSLREDLQKFRSRS